MESVVVVGAFRSPVGRLRGRLSPLSATALAAAVMKEALKRTKIKPDQVDEVVMGNVLSAGVGQNPARQAAIFGGLPQTAAAFTVNKVCASGLKAVALGAQSIMLGEADVIMTGGMESMSNAPYLLRDMRPGRKYGDTAAVDSMIYDGLRDCYYNEHMGSLCELTVKKYEISRKEQDAFALQSQKKAMDAAKKGFFKEELIPIKTKNGEECVYLDEDESIRWDTTLDKLSRLKPAFREDGTITAGNSPGLNDGAAVVILASEKKAQAMNLKPLARILGFSTGHLDPKWFTIAPVQSVKDLLRKVDLRIEDFDLIEENEAFAAQTIAVMKELSLDPAKVNVNGGAIALGHPIGASGARILVTLIHALRSRKKGLGLATICLGGGGAMSVAVRAYQ